MMLANGVVSYLVLRVVYTVFGVGGILPQFAAHHAWAHAAAKWDLFGPLLAEKLLYYPTVTREPFRNRGRITDLITSERLFNDIGLPPLNIDTDRIMMCGSPGMLEELRQTFEVRDFIEGSHSEPGHFVIEKAFVER